MDEKLNVVIKPVYDFAFPFEKGVAIVGNGCSFVPNGEYTGVDGGKWGAINKKGEIVYPVIYAKDELYEMLNKANASAAKSRADD